MRYLRPFNIVTLFSLFLPLLSAAAASGAADAPGAPEARAVIYLPYLTRSYPRPSLPEMQAIWVGEGEAEAFETVLFRKTVTLQTALSGAELDIFADTRYEAYLDGKFIGRGPARFSREIQEYDTYALPALPAGEHLLAVLVQWSPNTRRSESCRPGLYARLYDGSGKVYAASDSTWKAQRSTAWRSDAAPIHEWGLIGQSEQCDLNLLPERWNQPGFPDQTWANAAVVDRYSGKGGLQPRSIPQTVNVPMPAAVIDRGRLSPGFRFGELRPGQQLPYIIPLTSRQAGSLKVEVVSATGAPGPDLMRYSHGPVAWVAAGSARPDVYTAVLPVPAGRSELTIQSLPAGGLSFCMASDTAEFPALPFDPGYKAGRKLLLAQPVPEAAAVVTGQTAGGLSASLAGPQTYLVLDLGRTIHGRLEAQVEGPAGTIVDIGWDQRLYHGKRPLPNPGSLHGDLWDQTDSYILDGTRRSIRTIDARSGRYVVIAAWGPGPVRISSLQFYEERYPAVQTGSFESDDDLLNRIWQTGVETLYPNMTDAYTDTPWRERGQWWGDAYVSIQINRTVFGDTRLAARGLRFMAEPLERTGRPSASAPNGYGGHMLDYAMLWVLNLGDYVRQSGDIRLLEAIYPQVVQLIDHLGTFQGEWGLLEIPKGPWADTTYIDSYAWNDRWGVSTAANSLYCRTLAEAGYLAGWLGRGGDAGRYSSQAEAVRAAINDHLYDPANGRYYATRLDGVYKAASPYAQAYALSMGVVPGDRIQPAAEALIELTRARRTGSYAMYFVLDGLGQAGRIGEALDLIRSYYGGMLERGATTWWENFWSDEIYSGSYSHAWSGGPTWFLSRYLLGAESRGASWSLRPALTGVGRLSGSVPADGGALSVSWKRISEREAIISLEAPAGLGELILPASVLSVTLDGVEVTGQAQLREAEMAIALPAGVHQIHLSGSLP